MVAKLSLVAVALYVHTVGNSTYSGGVGAYVYISIYKVVYFWILTLHVYVYMYLLKIYARLHAYTGRIIRTFE